MERSKVSHLCVNVYAFFKVSILLFYLVFFYFKNKQNKKTFQLCCLQATNGCRCSSGWWMESCICMTQALLGTLSSVHLPWQKGSLACCRRVPEPDSGSWWMWAMTERTSQTASAPELCSSFPIRTIHPPPFFAVLQGLRWRLQSRMQLCREPTATSKHLSTLFNFSSGNKYSFNHWPILCFCSLYMLICYILIPHRLQCICFACIIGALNSNRKFFYDLQTIIERTCWQTH